MENDEDDILYCKSSNNKSRQDLDRLEYYRDINLNYEDDPLIECSPHSNIFSKAYILTGCW